MLNPMNALRIPLAILLTSGITASWAVSAVAQPRALFEPIDTAKADLTPKQRKILERIKSSRGAIAESSQVMRFKPGAITPAADTLYQIMLPEADLTTVAAKLEQPSFLNNATSIVTKAGASLSGIVLSDSADKIEILMPGTNQKRTVTKSDIENRQATRQSHARTLVAYSENRKEGVHLDLLGNATTGLIYRGDKVFAVEPLGGGLQAVTEIDMSKFDTHVHPESTNPVELILAPPPAADAPNTVITVLVAYTPNVVSQYEEDVSLVQSLVNSAIATANGSYQNSGVKITLELVGTHKVDFNEAEATHEDILKRFHEQNDGVMEEIHDLRNSLKADVCVLLVDNDSYCGLAAAIGASAEDAFAVVHYDCAVKNHSFAHEIGHLQGARHNREVDNTNDPNTPWNHGYLSPGDAKWRTIMAYPATGKPNRVPYWSNPLVKIDEVPTGTAAWNDNARVLNGTAVKISNFR